MSILLKLAFLFFVGSTLGWVLELFYRRYASKAVEKKWINPGFCTGPYLPLYGFGLCILYLIASLEQFAALPVVLQSKWCLCIVMAICMTVIEYIAGIMTMKLFHVRLWDYRSEWANIQGIICPKYSLYWALLGAVYYFFIHSHILNALEWLANNLAFSFVLGFFYGVFCIDVCISANLVAKLRQFAKDNEVIVRYDAIKSVIRQRHEETKQKYHFFRPFRSDQSLSVHLRALKESFEKQHKK